MLLFFLRTFFTHHFTHHFTRNIKSKPVSSNTSRFIKNKGFSLFEVLCVLFILTLLAGVSWNTSLAKFFQETPYEKIQEIQKSLASGLLFARQYAVQSQQSILLCGGLATTNQGDCSGDWSAGWFIEQDTDIKKYHVFPASTSIQWSGFPSDKAYIRFHANGHTDYQNGTFNLCFYGWQSRIVLNQSGRFYLGQSESIPKEGNGC